MGQPVRLREETRKNITDVAVLVSEFFKPCLGPVGMAKLVEDKDGVWFSDDPSLLLKKVGLQHPAAKAVSEAASSISGSFGDGACSFLIILAELLKGAGGITSKKTHPNRVINGWRIALDECFESPPLVAMEPLDRIALTQVARTVLADSNSRNTESLAPLVVEAVLTLSAVGRLDLSNFSVERIVGGLIEDSFFVKGVAMQHELADPAGPQRVRDSRIALLKGEVNEKVPDTWRANTKIILDGEHGIASVREARYRFLTGMAQHVVKSGANVLFIEKGMDPVAIEYLSRRGVMVVRRVIIEALERLAAATGGRLVYDIKALSAQDLGSAEVVESRLVDNREWVFVDGCRNPRAATFVVRAGNETLLHSTARTVERALKTVKEAQLSRSLVYGGGAWEMSLVNKLRRAAVKYEGRQQLAISAFADALEAIPLTLAENAGMDPISTIADLAARHASGDFRAGIDSRGRRLADMGELGVLDPFTVKRRVLLTAFGVGAMLIRIDSVVMQHELYGEARNLKQMEKNTDPERIEARRKEYGGMEKLEGPRLRPTTKGIRTLRQ